MEPSKYRLQVWEKKGTRVLKENPLRWEEEYWWWTLMIGTEAECRIAGENAYYGEISIANYRWRVISQEEYENHNVEK